MKKLNQYQILQLVLFGIIVIFWLLLGAGLVSIPKGTEGEWFNKIWDIILLVMSVRTLSSLVSNSNDLAKQPEEAKKETKNEKEPSPEPTVDLESNHSKLDEH